MNDALSKNRERLVQLRDAQRRNVSAASAAVRPGARLSDSTVVAGDRVFDLETGLEGEVIHVARSNVLIPAPKG